jgi:hypothetical protein
LEDFYNKKILYKLETEILENMKNDKAYEEKFLKDLVDFRTNQLKIHFVKIFKMKMIARSIIRPSKE